MARKFTKKQLLERAIVQRFEFTRRRIIERYAEFDWAMNNHPMPVGMPVPPNWVRVAIRCVAETTLRPLIARDPKNPANISRANLMQLEAMGVSSIAALQQGIGEVRSQVGEGRTTKRALEKLVRTTVNEISKRSGRRFQRATKATSCIPMRSPQQYQEDLENQTIGASAFINRSGELTEGQSMKAQLYDLLWFFWPMLTRIENVRQMREALQTVSDVEPSQKSLEAVCTKIGIFRGKRGRPAKKILRHQKFA